jgi:hypothetical protein
MTYIYSEHLQTPNSSDSVYVSRPKRSSGGMATSEGLLAELARLPSNRRRRITKPTLYSVRTHKIEENKKTEERVEERKEDIQETSDLLDSSTTQTKHSQDDKVVFMLQRYQPTLARTAFPMLSGVTVRRVGVQAGFLFGLSFVSFAVFQLVLPYVLSPFLDLFLPL